MNWNEVDPGTALPTRKFSVAPKTPKDKTHTRPPCKWLAHCGSQYYCMCWSRCLETGGGRCEAAKKNVDN